MHHTGGSIGSFRPQRLYVSSRLPTYEAQHTNQQGSRLIGTDRPRNSVKERDGQKSETATAPNPRPLPVKAIGNISTHQCGSVGRRLVHK